MNILLAKLGNIPTNSLTRYHLVCMLLTLTMLLTSCTTTSLKPALAFNPDPAVNIYWATFLQQSTNKTPYNKILGVSGFDENGVHVKGPIYPLGKSNYVMINRPAIAFSTKSKVFMVAGAELVAKLGGGTYNRIATRFFDSNGKLLKNVSYLFDDKSSLMNISPPQSLDVGSVRIAYNSLLDEFLVTAQRTVFDPKQLQTSKNGIWAQRISYNKGLLGNPVELVDMGLMNVNSHSIAFAPIAGTAPSGGRYLLSYAMVSALLLDSQAKLITNVPLNLGLPSGDHAQPDVAFGVISGKPQFLLVYGDGNNQYCSFGTQPCPAWSGVWGTYIDPKKTSYVTGADNNPFPISKITQHIANKYSYQARVDYNTAKQTFFVVWRELPVPTIKADETRTHIRGNKVDYYVGDGDVTKSGIKEPYVNIVISPVTGSCAASPPNVYCPSVEDPNFPDVQGLNGNKVAVYWQENDKVKANATHKVIGKVVIIP